MQKFPTLLWVVVVLNLVISVYSLSDRLTEKQKVVYVDGVRLLAKYKGMEIAKAELDGKSRVWQSNLDTLRMEFEKAASDFRALSKTATPKEKKLTEELARNRQEQYLSYEQTVKDQYQKQDQELSKKLLSKVNDYIRRYGEENGYTVILAATNYGNIAYADEGLDITEEVLVGLNKEYINAAK